MKVIRTVSAIFWCMFFALYLAAKVHFFTGYDPHGVGKYLEQHSILWAAMAVIAVIVWLLTKRSPAG